MSKNKANCILTALILVLLLGLISMIYLYDIEGIGPNGTKVGLSTINGIFDSIFLTLPIFSLISDIIMYFSIAVMLFFLGYLIYLIVKEKGIKNIDSSVILFSVISLTAIILSLILYILNVNYGPSFVNGELTNSMPSFQITITSVSLINTCIYLSKKDILNKNSRITIYVISGMLILFTSLCRILSLGQWFSDVCVSLLLSLFLSMAYYTSFGFIDNGTGYRKSKR